MISSRQRLSAAASRAALGLVLAGALAGGAHAQTASAHTYTSHKPLRGNYPGSYPSSATAPSVGPGGTFDWVDAGVGAAGMLGLVLSLTALNAGLRTARRNRAHDVPLVLKVRDDRPA
jgi:hypothetical protein